MSDNKERPTRATRNALRTPAVLNAKYAEDDRYTLIAPENACERCVKDQLPCFKAKQGTKKCSSCTSGHCSFTSPTPTIPARKSYITRAMGMLEGMMAVEVDDQRREALNKVLSVLRSGSGGGEDE